MQLPHHASYRGRRQTTKIDVDRDRGQRRRGSITFARAQRWRWLRFSSCCWLVGRLCSSARLLRLLRARVRECNVSRSANLSAAPATTVADGRRATIGEQRAGQASGLVIVAGEFRSICTRASCFVSSRGHQLPSARSTRRLGSRSIARAPSRASLSTARLTD